MKVVVYPTVPLERSIIEFIQENHSQLKKKTELNLMDIHELLELCLSKLHFVYNYVIWTLEDLEPIGLSIIVILSAAMFKIFFDDSHARFKSREQQSQILDILSSEDPSMQYTIEFENEDK